jgi:hypothetical protein
MSNASTPTPPAKPALDWRHILIGMAGALIPVFFKYLSGVDWSALGPMWASSVPGILALVNEFATTEIKTLS